MGRIKYFVEKHPDLFVYQKPWELHPHDRLMEKVFLRWLPEDVTPNRITALRILLTPVVFLLILFRFYEIGIVLFILVAFTDALDGSLARTRNKITNFGVMFDPLADKLLIGSIVMILVFKYFHWLLGVATLGLEIAFIAAAYVWRVKFKTVKMANLWGKVKMIFQVLAVFVTLLALLLDFSIFFTIAAWLFGMAIGFAILSLFTHGI